MSTPTAVNLAYAVTNVSASSQQLTGNPPDTVKFTFQPYFAASAGGRTENVKFGDSIDVVWQTADTTPLTINDVNGVPQSFRRDLIAAAVTGIAGALLAAMLAPPAPAPTSPSP